jgi:hypothetical protein
MADYKATTLAPTWNCRVPLNVNDSDLRLEMKEPPTVQGQSTEALFVVVRSELREFVRHTKFHLEFTNPALKPIAKDVQRGPIPEGGELVILEKMIEDKYLKFCDPENPLHFMTIWMTRSYIAKCRLVEHYSRYFSSSVNQTEAQRKAALAYALMRLECDTKIMSSPLTKGYRWLAQFCFPFPAYIRIVQDLSRRPISEQAGEAWQIMNDNYEARIVNSPRHDGPFFKNFTKIILQAWEAREEAFRESRDPLVPLRIVSYIRQRLAEIAQNEQNAEMERPNGVMRMAIDDFSMSMPIGFASYDLLHRLGAQDGYAVTGPGTYLSIPEHTPLDVDVNQLDWAAMDWANKLDYR